MSFPVDNIQLHHEVQYVRHRPDPPGCHLDGLRHGIHSLRYNHPSTGNASNQPGYDQGVFSGIVENENFLEHMAHPNDSLMGIIVSIYNLGCFAGCVVNFLVAERLGRRRAMWVAMLWVIVFCSPSTTRPG